MNIYLLGNSSLVKLAGVWPAGSCLRRAVRCGEPSSGAAPPISAALLFSFRALTDCNTVTARQVTNKQFLSIFNQTHSSVFQTNFKPQLIFIFLASDHTILDKCTCDFHKLSLGMPWGRGLWCVAELNCHLRCQPNTNTLTWNECS